MTDGLDCKEFDLAGYVDGELDTRMDCAIEGHLAGCSLCRDELNAQKQFLQMLETGLRLPDTDLELPTDFTKKIVSTAENNVVGLRPWKERFNAVFIISSLLLFSLFVLGADGAALISAAGALLHKLVAVGAFATQMAYSFLIGVVVLVRSLVSILTPSNGVAAMGVLAAVCLFLLGLKFLPLRKILRPLF
ncbi:MAG: zf-HC2 domain-containing protein [Acidobacteria bacterium]|nr:zf-HC2 domain-containing protein [Acidobacteriota bacterium]